MNVNTLRARINSTMLTLCRLTAMFLCMASNRALGDEIYEFLRQNPGKAYDRVDLWIAVFGGDSDLPDVDVQRRAIGAARRKAQGNGAYITHAVAGNNFTYKYTERSEDGLVPMAHLSRIEDGQRTARQGVQEFVARLRGTITARNRSRISRWLGLTESIDELLAQSEKARKELAEDILEESRAEKQREKALQAELADRHRWEAEKEAELRVLIEKELREKYTSGG